MRVLVVSDDHGSGRNLRRVAALEGKLDLVLHLGDSGVEEAELSSIFDCPARMVSGNCDYFSVLPKSLLLELAGHRVFLTHGHLYDVKWGLTKLSYAAEEAGADLVLFGHTHVPLIETYGKQTILNPGSIAQPRQSNRLCSYAMLVIDPKERVHVEIKYLGS